MPYRRNQYRNLFLNIRYLGLLRRGCPLDEKDSIEEDTPLHLATRHGNNEMVAILLRKGANTDVLNKVSIFK